MRILPLSTILLFFCCAASFGQTEIAHISDIYKNRVILPDEVVPLTDPLNQQFAICLFRGKVIDGYLFNKKYQIIDSLQSEDKQRAYKQIFGKTVLKNNNYVVFMANKSRKKFASVLFSFSENKVEFKELDLDLKKEKIIQTAEYNNKFHILTITPKTSIINVYRFDNANSYIKFPIDFSNQEFLDAKQNPIAIYNLITINSGMYGLGKAVDLIKIESSNPIALEIACNPTKFYTQGDKVILTFDQNETVTQLVEINLETMEGKLHAINKPLEDVAYKEKKSNSFLIDDILYQLVTSKEFIHISAQNYITKKIINNHSAHANSIIPFKNSSIVQTDGAFDNHREFENTGTLLRKVRRGKAGISVFKVNDLYQVTYGGIIERKMNPAMMMPGFGIPFASIGAVTIFFNPAFFAFESYTLTKALTVDGLFDANFIHQQGEITKNVFDRIQEFKDEEKVPHAGRTIFRLGDQYILGAYEGYTKKYSLWSFER